MKDHDWQESEERTERNITGWPRRKGFQMKTFGGRDKVRGMESDFYHNTFRLLLPSASSLFLFSILACLCLTSPLPLFRLLLFLLSCFCLHSNISSPAPLIFFLFSPLLCFYSLQPPKELFPLHLHFTLLSFLPPSLATSVLSSVLTFPPLISSLPFLFFSYQQSPSLSLSLCLFTTLPFIFGSISVSLHLYISFLLSFHPSIHPQGGLCCNIYARRVCSISFGLSQLIILYYRERPAPLTSYVLFLTQLIPVVLVSLLFCLKKRGGNNPPLFFSSSHA